jgi:hypothetical protein
MAGLDENKPAVDEEFDKLKVQNTYEFSQILIEKYSRHIITCLK